MTKTEFPFATFNAVNWQKRTRSSLVVVWIHGGFFSAFSSVSDVSQQPACGLLTLNLAVVVVLVDFVGRRRSLFACLFVTFTHISILRLLYWLTGWLVLLLNFQPQVWSSFRTVLFSCECFKEPEQLVASRDYSLQRYAAYSTSWLWQVAVARSQYAMRKCFTVSLHSDQPTAHSSPATTFDLPTWLTDNNPNWLFMYQRLL